MRVCALIVAILLIASARLPGQTTQPAEQGWAKAAHGFSRLIAEGDAGGTSRNLLAPNVTIRSLDGKPQDAARLIAAARNCRVILARAYVHEPLALAADIAAAFKMADFVPEDARRPMIPADDAEMARANAIATQWLAHTVSAKHGDSVGVIVLWPVGEANAEADPAEQAAHDADEAPAKPPQSLFILFKGEETAGGEFRISLVAFGNPLPAK